MLMFGKSAWNRQGALPNMGLEATNKLLYRDGSVCFMLKLNKENNLLLSLMAWKLWAPLPLGQTLLVLLGGGATIKGILHHVPGIVQDL